MGAASLSLSRISRIISRGVSAPAKKRSSRGTGTTIETREDHGSGGDAGILIDSAIPIPMSNKTKTGATQNLQTLLVLKRPAASASSSTAVLGMTVAGVIGGEIGSAAACGVATGDMGCCCRGGEEPGATMSMSMASSVWLRMSLRFGEAIEGARASAALTGSSRPVVGSPSVSSWSVLAVRR